jgi:hypothetical protein
LLVEAAASILVDGLFAEGFEVCLEFFAEGVSRFAGDLPGSEVLRE